MADLVCRSSQALLSRHLAIGTGPSLGGVKEFRPVGLPMPTRRRGIWAKGKTNQTETAAAAEQQQSKTQTAHRKKVHAEPTEDGSPSPIHPRLGLRHAKTAKEALTLTTRELVAGGHGILYGSRVPLHFFTCHGFGETDQGDGADPWETGSYDLALESAGIQDFNIITYTSVLPPEATPVSFEDAKPFFRHGAVVEAIMADMNGVKGDRITAGVGRMQIRRKKDKQIIGGYAAEYKGHATADSAREILKNDLQCIFERRFDPEQYEHFNEQYEVVAHEVEKNFGSVLAAICFFSYVEPIYVSTAEV